MRNWRKLNPEKAATRSRVDNERLLNRDTEYFKKWQAANKEKCKESERRYSKNNRPKIAAKSARRRIVRKRQTATLNKREKKMVQIIYNKSYEMGQDYVVDHIIPVSKGGSDHPCNLQIISATENNIKSDKINYKVVGIRVFWKNDILVAEDTNGTYKG